MNKKLTKPHEKNIRLEAPTGLIGVPPDEFNAGFTVLEDKVIIIADKPTAMRLLSRSHNMGSLPS